MSGRVALGGVVEATLAQMMGEDEIGERHLLVSFERGQGRSTGLGRLDCVFGPDRHTGNLTSVRAAELPIPFLESTAQRPEPQGREAGKHRGDGGTRQVNRALSRR